MAPLRAAARAAQTPAIPPPATQKSAVSGVVTTHGESLKQEGGSKKVKVQEIRLFADTPGQPEG